MVHAILVELPSDDERACLTELYLLTRGREAGAKAKKNCVAKRRPNGVSCCMVGGALAGVAGTIGGRARGDL